MRTESPTVRCPHCSCLYDPENSRRDCPHRALYESVKLTALREQGPPYKVESWTAAAVLIVADRIQGDPKRPEVEE